jgi:hypothetical protein
VKLRKEGFDDVDERRMTEKDSLSLSLSLSLSVVSFEMGFFIEGVDSGGESSWTLILGEAVLAQYFSGVFFSPLFVLGSSRVSEEMFVSLGFA